MYVSGSSVLYPSHKENKILCLQMTFVVKVTRPVHDTSFLVRWHHKTIYVEGTGQYIINKQVVVSLQSRTRAGW